jgi:quinol monooxygenase YgiN
VTKKWKGHLVGQVALLARFTAKEGKADELVAAFEPLIDQVRNEPGTLLYVMNRAKDDPNVFWFAELYADDDAFAAHGGSEAMAKAMPVLGPLIAESELVVGEPVLAKDFPGLAF